jgi:hypothetical protein
MLNTATSTVRSLEIQPAISTQSAGPNTATGANAFFLNDAGSMNTANGAETLYHNTTAFFNTAMGYQALPRQDLTSRRHLISKEIRIWLVMVRWIPAKSGQTPPLVTPHF